MLHIAGRQQAAAVLNSTAAFSSLPAQVITRVLGKFRVDKSYEPLVDLSLDLKYDAQLNKVLSNDVVGVTQGNIVTHQNALPFNGAPSIQEVEATRLPNGVTVVAADTSSPVVHMGVYSGVGTRFEDRANRGVLHTLKHAWFGTTTRRTCVGGSREPAQCGASINLDVGRDMMGITATCTRDTSDLILDHMTQSMICPEFFNHELEAAKAKALNETAAAMKNPDTVLLEEAHRVAYRGVGLGRSVYLKPENAGAIDREACLDFVMHNFRDANSTVLVGIGMDTSLVSELADEYLWSLEGGSVAPPQAPWAGPRESHIDAPGNTTRALFLTEGAAAGSHEALVLGLIRTIVGGGGSAVQYGTSHSQLMNAASHASHPHSAKCLNINYSDSGLFGLSVSGHAEEIGALLKSSVGVIAGLLNGISDEELQRAKNKFKLELILERDSVGGMLRHAGIESLGAGSPSTASQLCAVVDTLTSEDVVSMAKYVSKTCPILVSHGNGEHMPHPSDLQ